MLKITVTRNESQTTLVLEGQLADPWLTELERVWAESRSKGYTRGAVIDLKDVTSISKRGQELLEEMITAGAKFHCLREPRPLHAAKRVIHPTVSNNTHDAH